MNNTLVNGHSQSKLSKQNNTNSQPPSPDPSSEKTTPDIAPTNTSKHNHRNNLLKVDISTATDTDSLTLAASDETDIINVGSQATDKGKESPEPG